MALYWGWVVCGAFLLLNTELCAITPVFNQTSLAISKHFNMPLSIIAWMGSLPVGLAFITTPLGTVLNYKIGTRKAVMIGVMMITMALALTPIIKSFVLMLIVYCIIGGLGFMLVLHCPMFLLAEYFPYSHPWHVLATGITFISFPLGTLIFNPIANVLVDRVGWRITYSMLAVSMFIIGVSTTMTFRDVRKDEGIASLESQPSRKGEYEEIGQSERVVTKKTKVFMCTIWLIASAMKGMGYFTPFLTMVKQMVVCDIPQSRAAIVMVVIGSCELVSRLVTSIVGDYFKGTTMCMYAIFALGLSILAGLASLASTFQHFIIYSSALGVLEGPIIAFLYSASSEVLLGQEVHILYTLCRFGLGIGFVFGPMLTGAIFDATGSFRDAFYFTSCTYFIAAFLYGVIFVLNKTRPEYFFPTESEQATKAHMEQTNETSNMLLDDETSNILQDDDINQNEEHHEMCSKFVGDH